MRTLFLMAATVVFHATAFAGAPVHMVEEAPVSIIAVDSNTHLVDFGRVSFGNLELDPPSGVRGKIRIHFGEDLANGRVNRNPPGTVRYGSTTAVLREGEPTIAAPPPDHRNTEQDSPKHPPAILTPEEYGVVLPFRWVEIEGWPGQLLSAHIKRRSLFSESWDDDAAAFESSDPMLNKIWDLSRYAIKATTFAGVYVDGDRERIPYEADSYLNQLSHYATDNDLQMARETFDHLMRYPTWPTEWAPHMIFMAHADWMHTGDTAWLASRYEALKSKLLLDRKGRDGLIRSDRQQIRKIDIVDWPRSERDGYVFTSVNTVVNAFHIHALRLMAELAAALGKIGEADNFSREADRTHGAFQKTLFDDNAGNYRDGIDTEHTSLHASLFPLAFGLVPAEHRGDVTNWLAARGMRCSVYAAQYLLEGLFVNGAGARALELITAPGDRSWRHMVESGATITWEAWDHKYKPNQDWNHAWGAAPANLLPRFVLGAQAASPGWESVRIRPVPGELTFARGKIPTPRGPISVDWKNGETFELLLSLPDGMEAQVELPGNGGTVFLDGSAVQAIVKGNYLAVSDPVSGQAHFEVRPD